MKLPRLLELVNSQGLQSITDTNDKKINLDELKSARPFVFSFNEGGKVDQILDDDKIPALPFKLCSIELEGDGMIYANLTTGDFWISSYIVKEISPSKYHFYILASLDGIHTTAVVFSDSGFLNKRLVAITNSFIQRIATEKTGLCKCNEVVKLKNSNKGIKNNHKIKSYLYVTNNTNGVSAYGHPVNFTHSFEVRGHWRKIKGIGLDRNGERNVTDATWIRPYVKGDLSQEVITKTRIVKS